jgi:hypothetical protein
MNEPSQADVVPLPDKRAAGKRFAWSVWAVVAAFGTYFCMYAYRKPFTAGTYADEPLWGVDFKIVLLTAQVLGYMVSKFVGIKIIAEMKPERRAVGILILIGIAEFALLLFGLVPAPWNCLCLVLNGLPLGMVFGLVIGYLEGRQHTEALTAGLCTSFIIADGAMKSVGAKLMTSSISEYWMPFTAGLIFLPPLLVFVCMLTRLPPPSAHERAVRSERVPMSRQDRWEFFVRYGVGLTCLVLVYLLVTILRSIRSDFAPEIWKALDVTVEPDAYTQTEIVVAALVALLNGFVVLVRDNRRAFFLALAMSLGGLGLIAVALSSFHHGVVSAFSLVVLIGVGLYIPYVAVHTTIFERLIAMTRDRGNLGYLMYLADAFGYLGYVAVMFAKNFWGGPGDFRDFFFTMCWFIAAASCVLMILCWLYFAAHPATTRSAEPAATTV